MRRSSAVGGSRAMCGRLVRIVSLLLLIPWGAAPALAQQEDEPTRVVILGVGHSTQLVVEAQRPAALRAFFDRVAPDVIAVERSPEEFARGDHYEFTYEIQHLALPYAHERGLPVYPIDWIPSKDDMLLGFGVDLEAVPFLRGGGQGFLAFPAPDETDLPLFFADSDEDRASRRAIWEAEWEPVRRDMPRRLFLYRTFLQAQRIAAVAGMHPGRTILVPIGANHKDDIERILGSHPQIDIIQPSSFGEPTPSEIEAAIRREDLVAIAVFNLLGVQSQTENVDFDWMGRTIARLEAAGGLPAEIRLLAVRLGVLTGEVSSQEAIAAYGALSRGDPGATGFSWNGVQDPSRLDSYFDPFGNLSVPERVRVELAREQYKLGRVDAGDAVLEALASELPRRKAVQLRAYWREHLVGSK